jgi:hypothetical protein
MYRTTSQLRAEWLSMRLSLQRHRDSLPVLHRISTPFQFGASAWNSKLNAWCDELDTLLSDYPEDDSSEAKPFGARRHSVINDSRPLLVGNVFPTS